MAPLLPTDLRCRLSTPQVRYRLKHDPLVELSYATQLRTRWVAVPAV